MRTLCLILLFFFCADHARSQTDLCFWLEPDSSYVHAPVGDWIAAGQNYSPPILLPFEFHFFGEVYQEVVITTFGTIAMGNNGYDDPTPSSFPQPLSNESEEQYDHICGFWSDFDFSASGDIYYKVTEEALYVNYINAGYFPEAAERRNSFQMIIAANGNSVIGDGNNVQFFYKDMQWANGAHNNAVMGFNADNGLAIVGADENSGPLHYCFGRFNQSGAFYNGPYGVEPADQDGVDWLDGRMIEFTTDVEINSLRPGVVANICPDFAICDGDYDYEYWFINPDLNDSIAADVAGLPQGFTYEVNTWPQALQISGEVNTSDALLGEYEVDFFSAVNDVLPDTSMVHLQLSIAPQNLNLSVSGDTEFCSGDSVSLSATSGMDLYQWSTGDSSQTIVLDHPGTISVYALKDGCYAEETLMIEEFFPPDPSFTAGTMAISICPGQDTSICLVNTFESVIWTLVPGYNGEYAPGADLTAHCVDIEDVEGAYRVQVTDAHGCRAEKIMQVEVVDIVVPLLDPAPQCDLSEPVVFSGAELLTEEPLVIYAVSTSSAGWQDSYIEITVHHADGSEDVSTLSATNSFTVFGDLVLMSGDSVVIVYYPIGEGAENNSVWVADCGFNIPLIIAAPMSAGVIYASAFACVGDDLSGSWSVDGPAGWQFSDPSSFNTDFFAAGNGYYEACFTPDVCNHAYCYEVEFPSLVYAEFQMPSSVVLCEGDSLLLSPLVNTNEDLIWSGENLHLSEDGYTAYAGPYNGSGVDQIIITQSNACSDDSDELLIYYQEELNTNSFDDVLTCADAAMLDPLPDSSDQYVECIWTSLSSGAVEIAPEYTVTSDGFYTLQFANDCSLSPVSTFSVILESPAAAPTALIGENAFCDNEGLEIFSAEPGNVNYTWIIEPADAGSLVYQDQDSVFVDFTDGYAGDVLLAVSRVNSCGPGPAIDMQILIDDCSAVQEEDETSWTIFPNPADEHVQIMGAKDSFSITLLDVSGQEVLHTQDTKVDTSKLPSGLYIVRLQSSAGVQFRRLEILH